jgi:two-component system chemotaxis sensor kinase CheA
MPDDKIDYSMFLDDYMNDAIEGFQEANSALLALEKDMSQTEQLDYVFRAVHNLKSSSAMLEFSDIAELAHCSEEMLDRLRRKKYPVGQEIIDMLFEVIDLLGAMVKERGAKKGKTSAESGTRSLDLKENLKRMTAELESAADIAGPGYEEAAKRALQPPSDASEIPKIDKIQTVRVKVELLDSLFNLVGELIINKNRIDNLLADSSDKELKSTLAATERLIASMQDNVSTARLVAVEEIFQKFPRLVRDLARERGKEVDFVLEGRDIEMDKSVLDTIGEPLIHLLRNAVDHAIEPPGMRILSGKPKEGAIRLAAKRTEDRILIEVEDDGAGIDVEMVKKIGLEKGMITPEAAAAMPEKDILALIFMPGFTSASEVTEISGRGVGLDVVKTSVEKLNGTVDITTAKGAGARFTLRLPLTQAIMQTLLVGTGDHIFAIPSDTVTETLEVKEGQLKEIGDRRVLVLREDIIPFVGLENALHLPAPENRADLIAVILNWGEKKLALGVESVLDQMENIIKPFDPIARQFSNFSGGIIMGDGKVALLLDVPALFREV